jgi:hypothetical protein
VFVLFCCPTVNTPLLAMFALVLSCTIKWLASGRRLFDLLRKRLSLDKFQTFGKLPWFSAKQRFDITL